ncbi:MAG: ATP-binding cassette domain-containing protein [Bacteroidales bacterium]|jgi:cell division transport system ATP-binding protein|nr:ATP-binding cassette domain-containing protein [Bacteroidales bacterium]
MEENTVVSIREMDVFQDDILVLKGVNLEVNKGDFFYIIGKTGSGKSSLLKTLYADLPFVSGEAQVVGYDLQKLKRKDIPFLRRKLGIVFQEFQLLQDRNIEENLFFVMRATGWKDKKAMKDKATEILGKVGLQNKGYKMPHQVSGGEQQRLGIARALINDPVLILADEPTGNLDPQSSEGIIELLLDISKNKCAVLMATHDYSLFEKFPSQTFVCEHGRLIEGGKGDASTSSA